MSDNAALSHVNAFPYMVGDNHMGGVPCRLSALFAGFAVWKSQSLTSTNTYQADRLNRGMFVGARSALTRHTSRGGLALDLDRIWTRRRATGKRPIRSVMPNSIRNTVRGILSALSHRTVSDTLSGQERCRSSLARFVEPQIECMGIMLRIVRRTGTTSGGSVTSVMPLNIREGVNPWL